MTTKTATKTEAKSVSRVQISKMTPAELIIELARRGIKDLPEHSLKGKATCPHCEHEGPIQKDFGVRIMRGQVWPQSWCRECRAGNN